MDDYHMRYWDESMFAVNTYEMIENGKCFSLYYDGYPDLYNTKPPLIIWFQVAFVKIFGYSEVSLRLPSVIAVSITVLVLFKFLVRQFDYVWAWCSVLILLTAQGYIGFHTARTADSDSVLTMFLVITNLFFIKYIIENKRRDIICFFIFLTLAFGTKLFAAFLFVPAYLLILIYYKKLSSFIFNKSFLIGTFIFVTSVFSLMAFRELETPGYIAQVLGNDAGRLFLNESNAQSSVAY